MGRFCRIGFVLFAVLFVVGVACPDVHAESRKFTDDYYLVNEIQRELAPGITDRRIVLNTEDGDRQTILYVCEFDIREESVEMFAGYPNNNPSMPRTDTVTNQAAALETATGKDVVVAVNNNYYNEDTGIPLDIMVKDGKLVYGVKGQYFFGCTFDDQPAIGCYGKSTPPLKEAVGGRFYIVEKGKAHKIKSGEITSRNAVGVKPDGTAVYLVTHGKNSVVSNGIDVDELAEFMVALGCENAVFPDGGGSSTYAVQAPGADQLTVENNPSYGAERNVSTTLLITSSEAGHVPDTLTACQKNGHKYEKTKTLIKCSECEEQYSTDEFTGLVTDKSSGRKMYYINGKYQTGWSVVDQEAYYFNGEGLAEKTTVKEIKELECNSDGYTIYRCGNADEADGREFKVPASYMAPGHNYDENNICSRCGWKEVAFEDCTVETKAGYYTYTGAEIKPSVIIKYKGQVLRKQYDYRIAGYEDNVEYGTGKIYITTDFINGAELSRNSSSLQRSEEPYVVTFEIKPPGVTGLVAKATGTDSIELSWDGKENVDGYEIYRVRSGKEILLGTVNDSETTVFTVKGLSAGYGYNFKVRTYVGDKEHYSVCTGIVKASTKPGRVVMNKLKTGKTHYVKASWKKKAGTGYQVMIAANSKFTKEKKVYKITSAKTLSKKITKLKKGKRYYIKVRAYKTYGGKTQYGQWSKYRAIRCK